MKVADLREILQYVPRFREKIFVVAVDGEVAASPGFGTVLVDLAVLRSLNVKVILVHGAAYQVERLAAERGVNISNSDGSGITDDQTLQVALDAASRLQMEILQGLTQVDLRAACANAIIAHPAGILGGLDYQKTGKVERIDLKTLHLFLNDGIVPVISPIGFDGEGHTFRVNSDSVAIEVGEAMNAAKVLYLGSADPVKDGERVVAQLSIAETEDLIRRRRGEFPPGVISKLQCAARACRSGVPRVHLLNGNLDGALLSEVFSYDGVGTMVYSNDYQQVRRLYKKDIRAVLAMIAGSVKDSELVKRTRAEILSQLDDYWVLEIDRSIAACVALHPFPEQQKGELACLYVAKAHEGQGFGRKLVAYVEQVARQRGLKDLFALSTQTFNFFVQKAGFHEVTADYLPDERRKRYEASGRNSKVLRKDLMSVGTAELPRV